MSPERALAANQETANIYASAASQMGTPQAYAATASMLAGKQMANNADIVSTIHNQNVQIANSYDSLRNQTLNNASAIKASMNTNLYDKIVIANQQFDNEKRQAQRNLINAFNQAWTNRGMADTMNKMSDFFSIDPITYTVYFDKEKARELEARKEHSRLDDLNKAVQNINEMNVSDDTKKELMKIVFSHYYDEKDNKTFFPNYNPYMPFTFQGGK